MNECSSFSIQAVPVVAPSLPASSCLCVEVPRTVHLASTVLPAGGIFTSQQAFPIPLGIRKIAFYVTYANGGFPGGFAVFRLLWGNGTEEVQETILDTDLSIIPPTGVQSLLLQDLNGPAPSGLSPVTFIIYTTVPGGAIGVRLIAAEKGFIGLPGTLSIALTASS
jgi:hypothetical protein